MKGGENVNEQAKQNTVRQRETDSARVIHEQNKVSADSIIRKQLLMSAREVLETHDSKTAAQLLQSGAWIAHNALFTKKGICWCLLRISDIIPD